MGELTTLLAQLTGREFECFIRDLWAARGWDAQLTSQSGDDGVDVVLERYQFYQQRKLIQTKCTQPDENLSRSKVQQYSYLLHEDNVDEAILMTTGGFSEGARQSATKANLKLIDGETLESLVFDTLDLDSEEFTPESYVPEYDFEATTDSSETGEDDPLSGGSKPVEPADLPSQLHSRVDELSDQEDIYNRLLATIGNEHLSLDTRLPILFQLFRGEKPFHLLLYFDADSEYRPLLNRVTELQDPRPAEHINSRRAQTNTVVGELPKSSGGDAGLLSQLDDGLIVLSEFTENKDLCNHLVEPLKTGILRSTKWGTHETTSISISALAVATPKYGRWDRYEPMWGQLDLPPSAMTAFDTVIYRGNTAEMEPIRLPAVNGYANTEPLSEQDFKAYRIIANELDPTPTDTVSTLLQHIKTKIKGIVKEREEEDHISESLISNWMDSLQRAAKASARIELREFVHEDDIYRASVVLPTSLFGIEFNELVKNPTSYSPGGGFDAEVVETGKSRAELDAENQRDRIKNIKALISDIEEEFEEGAPIAEVLDRADKIGMDASKAEQEIEKLRRKGEVYEPAQDHLRAS